MNISSYSNLKIDIVARKYKEAFKIEKGKTLMSAFLFIGPMKSFKIEINKNNNNYVAS